jgi:tRNA pseudouridine55 synthase
MTITCEKTRSNGKSSKLVTGIINLNKPPRLSSAAAVGRVKRLLERGTRVGHAGTLDPFATGVLLILVGKATKSCEKLMDEPKQYETTMKFGATTATDDCEAPEIPWTNPREPNIQEIERKLSSLIGRIEQRPPAFSALKIAGQAAYKLARRGKAVDLQPRPVRIDAIQILDWQWPFLKLRIDCGRGTYIRAIARDLGEMLGVGGYLTQLCRTRIGNFRVENAVTLDQLSRDGIESHLQLLA